MQGAISEEAIIRALGGRPVQNDMLGERSVESKLGHWRDATSSVPGGCLSALGSEATALVTQTRSSSSSSSSSSSNPLASHGQRHVTTRPAPDFTSCACPLRPDALKKACHNASLTHPDK